MPVEYDYVKTKRKDVDELPKKWIGLIKSMLKFYTRLNVWVYKKSNGKLMKNFLGGYPICIVGTTGKKSGLRREIALIHLPYKKNKLLVASQGGMDSNPLWYHNIKAYPKIDIMVGGDKEKYQATQLEPSEKAQLWPHLLSLYPDFDEYQARTDRDIPVFMCKPLNAQEQA